MTGPNDRLTLIGLLFLSTLLAGLESPTTETSGTTAAPAIEGTPAVAADDALPEQPDVKGWSFWGGIDALPLLKWSPRPFVHKKRFDYKMELHAMTSYVGAIADNDMGLSFLAFNFLHET